jgi:hypothetical protein
VLQRHRDVAAAPRRPATATWQAITDLVADTLDRSPHLTRADVEGVLLTARIAGLPLVAGGHLDKHPITLVAGAVNCTIGTVSGTAALSLEENLSPIPGGASAIEFTLHLPTPDPLEDLVRTTAQRSRHLSAEPPAPADPRQVSDQRQLVDFEALARRKAHQP